MLFSVLFILRFAFLTSVICAFSSLTVLVVSLCISCLSQSCHRLRLFTFCLCVKSAFLLCYFLFSCDSLFFCVRCVQFPALPSGTVLFFLTILSRLQTPLHPVDLSLPHVSLLVNFPLIFSAVNFCGFDALFPNDSCVYWTIVIQGICTVWIVIYSHWKLNILII